MEKRQIFYHDSLNHNKGEAVDAMSCVSALIEAVILSEFGTGLNLKDLTIGNYCVPLDRLGKFELIDYVDNPKQDNGSDCGVFTVKGIDYYTRKLVPNFGPDDIPYFRRLICLELCDGRLRVPKWMT